MHVYHEFPKWKYHATEEPKIVQSKDEERALGEAWVDSPADAVAEPEETLAEEIEEILRHRGSKKPGKRAKP